MAARMRLSNHRDNTPRLVTCQRAVPTFLLLGLAALSGCATVAHGTRQKVLVVTEPSGATVRADGRAAKTPTELLLARKTSHRVTIHKPGYHTVELLVERAGSAMIAGNIVSGGVVGLGVDSATGAGHKLLPREAQVTLEPRAPGEPARLIRWYAPHQAERHDQIDQALDALQDAHEADP